MIAGQEVVIWNSQKQGYARVSVADASLDEPCSWDANLEPLSVTRVGEPKDKTKPIVPFRKWRFATKRPLDWVLIRQILEAKPRTTVAQDVAWVADNWLYPSVEALDCLSASALGLWQWAKKNPREFHALRVRIAQDVDKESAVSAEVRASAVPSASIFEEKP